MRFIFCCVLLLANVSCDLSDFGYDPRPSWERFEKQRKIAHQKLPQLTEKGELPVATKVSDLAVAENPIDEKYALFCASCHGLDGRAQTAAGMAVKSRNLTDVKWQESVSDEHIYKVIKHGGTSVGLSGAMAAWGALLSDDEITQMVQKVRSYKGK